MRARSIIITILSLMTVVSTHAQQGWEIGGYGGIAYYLGDLNNDYNLELPGFAAGIMGRYNFDERISIRFDLGAGQVRADDALSENEFELRRNLHFKSLVVDFGARFDFHFLPYIHGDRRHYFTPYITGGYGISWFNPKAEYNGEWVELQPLGTEGQELGDEYFRISGAWLLGLGLSGTSIRVGILKLKPAPDIWSRTILTMSAALIPISNNCHAEEGKWLQNCPIGQSLIPALAEKGDSEAPFHLMIPTISSPSASFVILDPSSARNPEAYFNHSIIYFDEFHGP